MPQILQQQFELLAYIASLDLAVTNGSILGYKAPLVSLKRNVEGNPRQSIFAYKSFTNTVGVRGDINDDWSYDVYYQTSTVNYNNEYRNDLSVTNINRAVDVISVGWCANLCICSKRNRYIMYSL